MVFYKNGVGMLYSSEEVAGEPNVSSGGGKS
jgi:hypothetical protein